MIEGFIPNGLSREMLDRRLTEQVRERAEARLQLRLQTHRMQRAAFEVYTLERALREGLFVESNAYYSIDVDSLRKAFPEANVQVDAEFGLDNPGQLCKLTVEVTEPHASFTDRVLTVKLGHPTTGTLIFNAAPGKGLIVDRLLVRWQNYNPRAETYGNVAVSPTPHCNAEDPYACVMEETRRTLSEYANEGRWADVVMLVKEYLNTYDVEGGPYIGIDAWAARLVDAKVPVEITSTGDDGRMAKQILEGRLNMVVCEECGAELSIDEAVRVAGDYYCEDCAPQTVECSLCGALIDEGDEYRFNYGTRYDYAYCQGCFDRLAVTCEVCGEQIHQDDTEETAEGALLCNRCYCDETTVCEKCEDVVLTTNSRDFNGLNYCEACYDRAVEDNAAKDAAEGRA